MRMVLEDRCHLEEDTIHQIVADAQAAVSDDRAAQWVTEIRDADNTRFTFTLDVHFEYDNVWFLALSTRKDAPESHPKVLIGGRLPTF